MTNEEQGLIDDANSAGFRVTKFSDTVPFYINGIHDCRDRLAKFAQLQRERQDKVRGEAYKVGLDQAANIVIVMLGHTELSRDVVKEIRALIQDKREHQAIIYVDEGHLREVSNGNEFSIYATADGSDKRLIPLYLLTAINQEGRDIEINRLKNKVNRLIGLSKQASGRLFDLAGSLEADKILNEVPDIELL